MEVISFGRDRDPGHWLPDPWRRGWRGLVRRLRGWPGLVIAAVVLAGLVGVLVVAGGNAHHVPSAGMPAMAARPAVLAGVPARRVRTDLVLGGDSLWQLETGRPRQVLSGLLGNGLSPLLARSGAAVRLIEPAAGGVIAVIGNPTAPQGADATLSAVLFITARGTARVIARASAAAVAPGGRAVWVQTGVTSSAGYPPPASPATVWSPTYAVSLSGRRLTPVLRLPLGLAAATGAGLLTDDVETGQLALWNAGTGSREQLPLPSNAGIPAEGNGVVIWQALPCPARCPLQLTDVRDGAGVTLQIPAGWWPVLYHEPVSFDASGTRFVLPLARTDASGNPVAEALFLADTATRTIRAIPGGPSASDQPLGLGDPGVQLTGAWDQHGLLWVLASSGYGYFQLGYWTGHGPLHVYPPVDGNPAALAPG